MLDWLLMIVFARKLGLKVMVYGCGIGPVHSKEIKKIIKLIGEYSTTISLRDSESKELIKSFGTKKRIAVSADPSLSYQFPEYEKKEKKRLQIAFALRKWYKPYLGIGNIAKKFESINTQYKNSIILLLRYITKKYEAKIVLVPMHTLEGDDDLKFMKNLVLQSGIKGKIKEQQDIGTPDEIMRMIKESDILIGMRFHSIIFSFMAKTPMLCIDYDVKKGKIGRLAERISIPQYCINIKDLDKNILKEKMDSIIKEKDKIKRILKNKKMELLTAETVNKKELQNLLKN